MRRQRFWDWVDEKALMFGVIIVVVGMSAPAWMPIFI